MNVPLLRRENDFFKKAIRKEAISHNSRTGRRLSVVMISVVCILLWLMEVAGPVLLCLSSETALGYSSTLKNLITSLIYKDSHLRLLISTGNTLMCEKAFHMKQVSHVNTAPLAPIQAFASHLITALFFFFNIFYFTFYLFVVWGIHLLWHHGGQRSTPWALFSFPFMRAQRTKLRSSGLVASALSRRTLSPAPQLRFLYKGLEFFFFLKWMAIFTKWFQANFFLD